MFRSEAYRGLLRFVLKLFDLALFSVLSISILSISPFVFRRNKKKRYSVNILRLIEGGDLQSIYRKYGNLDNYFYHIIPGFTALVVGSNFGTQNNFKLRLRDDYILMETLYIPHLSLVSHFYFIFRHLIIIRKYNICIVHANSPYLIGVLGVVLAKITSLPFCVSIHADYNKSEQLQGNVIPRICGSRRISQWIEKVVYQNADLVLPIRESMKPHLVKAGCSEEKIRVFPHGIDLEPFLRESELDVREYFKLPEDAKIVSSVGRVEQENYSEDIFEIAIQSVQKSDKLYFIICGNGSQLEPLRRRTQEHGQAERILLPGPVKQSVVFELRRESDINLCLMGGFSLIEACAAGRPVISYDVEWHYELVQDGKTGYLVQEKSVDDVVKKIIYLHENAPIAESMGVKAQQAAFKKHSLEVVDKIKTSIYMELI